jgi:zinc protease
MEELPGRGEADESVPARTGTADSSAVTEIEQYELDDIPLLRLPMAGSTILTLSFRVGRADEPVPRGGMTHLAEHLIMTAVSDALDHSNGSTEPYRVTFTIRGTPAEVSRFLRDVCKAIERPPLHRMHEEANVLRTEAAGRSGSMGMSLRLIWFRTGFQGLGTTSLPELFLRKLDEGVLRAWMAEHLVTGNAAIWIAGDIPDDLMVWLEPGPRKAPPEQQWIRGLETPTLVVDEMPGVGASFHVERTVASATAFRSLDRQLRRALRVDRGLGYDVGAEYFPISPDRALATVWASCLPNAVRDVERVMLETIDDIAARGPSEEELAHHYETFVRQLLDPMAIPGRLESSVKDLLIGKPPELMSDLADQYWRVQPDEVAAAFRQARESMLVLVPPSGERPQRPFKPYPGTTIGPMGNGGTFDFASTKRKVPWGKSPSPKLTVADAGVAVNDSRGRRIVGIRWEDCVAVVCEPDFRSIVGSDGAVLRIEATEWREGRRAIRLVDRLAPGDLVIPVAS